MVERSVTMGEASELNRTRDKRGETGAGAFFSSSIFRPRSRIRPPGTG